MPRKTVKWETLCRRTNYPKLGYLIYRLKRMGIKCRFARCAKGLSRTFHADRILEVQSDLFDEAWRLLGERWSTIGVEPNPRGRTTLDDMPDDHWVFKQHKEERP